ncbi:LuxR family transcriptional regulator [Streptomyces evansiae]|uniref:LuxR family transcriptional regulator n=1 Tax=Streptomyces evansiae TaxID=3075535 RepID=UPI00288770DA|nr:LuxR family transcriptional regulator [Streptomyces sp. DSM 41859]MDT0420898.1 LuxR family transcriptional regulator [Streptomyces sp. DSM 41859]
MIGELVWDARREVLAIVTGRLGRYWWLRPLGGGREWNAGPDEVRSLPAPGTYAKEPATAPALPVAEDALACRLGTTTREDIAHYTRLLREQAEALLGAGVPEETADMARALLDSPPSREEPAFAAYAHMQDLARLLRHHLRREGEASAARREAARCEAARCEAARSEAARCEAAS